MSEQPDKSQKTEEATPRRKEKMRKEGKIAKSVDIGSAAVIISVFFVMSVIATDAGEAFYMVAGRFWSFEDLGNPVEAIRATLPLFTVILAPIVITAMIAAIFAGVLQTRGLFQPSLLAIKPERFNPIPQLKKILPGKESGIELLKQLLKLTILGWVVFQVIVDATPMFAVMASAEMGVAISIIGSVIIRVGLYGGIAFACIAALDYMLARRRFAEDAKMSYQEVRDEHKEQEGDPFFKRHRRQKMRQLADRRAIADVGKATVVVTNPTHIAVALRYEPATDFAPMVIAKGVDSTALAMRRRARQHGVPIVENKPLARAMHRDAKIGSQIPVDLYTAVAEVIAHVMRIRGAAA
jgi:flagellar biosynthetic protein FlhB